MTAEANLYNPALFEGVHYPVWELVDEYMEVSLAYGRAAGVVIGCWAERVLYVCDRHLAELLAYLATRELSDGAIYAPECQSTNVIAVCIAAVPQVPDAPGLHPVASVQAVPPRPPAAH
jgi:hypothetical protein